MVETFERFQSHLQVSRKEKGTPLEPVAWTPVRAISCKNLRFVFPFFCLLRAAKGTEVSTINRTLIPLYCCLRIIHGNNSLEVMKKIYWCSNIEFNMAMVGRRPLY